MTSTELISHSLPSTHTGSEHQQEEQYTGDNFAGALTFLTDSKMSSEERERELDEIL